MNIKRVALTLIAAGLLPLAAQADLPGHHPGYLHALTDLRDARWNLEHRPGDAAVSAREDVAITEVDAAIREAKVAAAEDGKNLADRPRSDAGVDRPGRLHRAAELLRQAKADVAQEEDNPQARQLRNRVAMHIDNAIRATDNAIRAVELHR